MHVHAPWLAFRAIIGSAVLEVADQLLFLGVDGDHRLLLGLRRHDFRVDIFELRVSVGMFGAFIRLAIGLAREPELPQLLAHRVGADRMSHLGQGRRELLHAFRHPDQGPHRITQRRRLDQPFERANEPRIVLRARATPAAGAANAPPRQRCRIQIILPAIDCRTSQPGDLGDGRKTTPPSAPHLARGKQPPSPLVELRTNRFPPAPNRVLVDHPTDLRRLAQCRNPRNPSHSVA